MDALKTATPIVISAIALIISLVTYLSSITPANITLSIGEWMEVFHDKDQALYIHLPLVFQNTGARAGVIRSLGLVIKDPETKEAIFVKPGLCQGGRRVSEEAGLRANQGGGETGVGADSVGLLTRRPEAENNYDDAA